MDAHADHATLDALGQRIGRTVRDERLGKRWSLGDLARASGLSKTILARIERGDGNPSIETLWRVSQALGVPLGTLLAPSSRPRTRLLPARAAEPLISESGMAARLLHAEGRPHRSEIYDIELPRGVDQRSDPHLPGTEELIVCIRGRLRLGPYEEEVELGPGDAAWFAADVAHHYVALREDAHAVLDAVPGRAAVTRAATLQPAVAGIIAAVVGFASAFAIVLAGLRAVGADDAAGRFRPARPVGHHGRRRDRVVVAPQNAADPGLVDAGRGAAHHRRAGPGRLSGGARGGRARRRPHRARRRVAVDDPGHHGDSRRHWRTGCCAGVLFRSASRPHAHSSRTRCSRFPSS
jgi:transcriptional regulator with XRE-family HTH domain